MNNKEDDRKTKGRGIKYSLKFDKCVIIPLTNICKILQSTFGHDRYSISGITVDWWEKVTQAKSGEVTIFNSKTGDCFNLDITDALRDAELEMKLQDVKKKLINMELQKQTYEKELKDSKERRKND